MENPNKTATRKTINDALDGYVIYFAGDKNNLQGMNASPFGKAVQAIDVYDTSNKTFFDLLNQLDGLSYGDKSMAAPKWVSLDCGLLPSGFVGLAKNVQDCPKEVLEKYDIPAGYTGLVPITEYCAIPSANPGYWVSHTCATIVKGENLGLVSKILGISMFKIKKYLGIAQYDNAAVKTHTQLGDLLLKSAITPAHSDPEMTFVYEQEVDDAKLQSVYSGQKAQKHPDFLLDPSSMEEKQELQDQISQGKKVYITAPGQVMQDEKIMIPIIIEG